MKYIIWGTGGAARKFLCENILSFFVNGDIVAIVDSDKTKEGKTFFGRRVILPTDAANLVYDRMIICSTYYDEIVSEACRMGLDTEKIVSMIEIKRELANYYIENCGITEKEVLILGDKKYQMFPMYKEYFQKLSFLSLNEISKLREYKYDYIILTELSNTEFNTESEDELTLQNKMILRLIDEFGVKQSAVLPSSTFMMIYADNERWLSYGDEYSDKTFLEIRLMGYAGWGLYFHVVSRNVLYAYKKGYIPVVNMMACHNTYLEEDEVGKVNAWEKFFEQPAGYTMSDVYRAKNVILASLEQEVCDNPDFYRTLIMKPRLQSMFDSYMETFYSHERTLGVLYRGTDYVNLKPYNHPIQPTLSEMLDKVEEKRQEWGLENIYLCTEVEEAVQAFKERFGDKVFVYPQMRYSEKCSDYLGMLKFKRKEDAFYRGADYWILLNALAKCDSLIAGQCGGTHMAIEINGGKYNHVFQFDLGKYGVTKSQDTYFGALKMEQKKEEGNKL